jgi:hypothetical protein
MKYELMTKTTISMLDKTLYQIRALKDFGNIKTGDLGGWIHGDVVLPQDDESWIYPGAMFTSGSIVGDSLVTCHGIYNNVHVVESIIEGTGRFESLHKESHVYFESAKVKNDGEIIINNEAIVHIYGNVNIKNSTLLFDGSSVTLGSPGYTDCSINFDGNFKLTGTVLIYSGTFTNK